MLADREKCTGCAACYCTCENESIEMKEDMAGFKYPYINVSKCINCKKCEMGCPVLHPNLKEKYNQSGYILQNKDKNKLYESTSGAVFPEIAEYVIGKGGKVYGAAFSDDLCVEHIAIESIDELHKLKKSKYVQSYVHNIYRDIKYELNQNREICFSGTPCQVEGLLAFLGRGYSNLITVDIVCHGVGAPTLWKKYIGYKEKKGKIGNACFRDKTKGYQYTQMRLDYINGTRYLQGTEYDQMLRAFFSNICDRESCYNCSFKKENRVSDITVWDSFDNKLFGVDYDENVGSSKMLINSNKGLKVFNSVKNSFYYKEIDAKKLIDSSYEMTHSVSKNPKREQFMFDLGELSTENLFRKYFPIDIKVRIKKAGREFLYRIGIYAWVRRKVNRISRKLKKL